MSALLRLQQASNLSFKVSISVTEEETKIKKKGLSDSFSRSSALGVLKRMRIKRLEYVATRYKTNI